MGDVVYQDAYEGCVRTYVSLNVRREAGPTSAITEALSIQPDETSEPRPRELRDGVVYAARPAFWTSRTEDIQSTDFERHLDTLLERFAGSGRSLAELRAQGWQMDVSVYWLSRWGHGGPELRAHHIEALSALGVGIWFDIYFHESDDLDAPVEPGDMTPDFRRLTRHWRRA